MRAIKVINWLFEVKTEDRAACVTEEIFWGKESISGRRARWLKTPSFAVYVLLELSGLSGRTAAAGLKCRF